MTFNRRSFMAAALAGAALFGSGLSAAAQTELNLSDVLPESNFMVKNAMRFAEEVSAATADAVDTPRNVGLRCCDRRDAAGMYAFGVAAGQATPPNVGPRSCGTRTPSGRVLC